VEKLGSNEETFSLNVSPGFFGRNDSDARMMVDKEKDDGGNDAEQLTVVPVPNCPRTSSKSGLAAASRGQG